MNICSGERHGIVHRQQNGGCVSKDDLDTCTCLDGLTVEFETSRNRPACRTTFSLAAPALAGGAQTGARRLTVRLEDSRKAA